MREFEYYSKKDDVIDLLNKEGIKLNYLERNNRKLAYVDVSKYVPLNYQFNKYKFMPVKIITLEEGTFNFRTNIYTNGYLSEHPLDKKAMDKEYNSEEFVDLIKNNFSEIKDTESICKMSDDKPGYHRIYRFIGFTFKKVSTLDYYEKQYVKNNRFAVILYIEDGDFNIYRIEAYTVFGMEAYFETSWSYNFIEKLEGIDKNKLLESLPFTTNKEYIKNYKNFDVSIYNRRENIQYSVYSGYSDLFHERLLIECDTDTKKFPANGTVSVRYYSDYNSKKLDLTSNYSVIQFCYNLKNRDVFDVKEDLLEEILNEKEAIYIEKLLKNRTTQPKEQTVLVP